MKAVKYIFILLAAFIFLVGCSKNSGNQAESNNTKKVVKAETTSKTKATATTSNNNQNQEKKPQPSLKILGTVDKFGGGTFNPNSVMTSPSADFYVEEVGSGSKVFLTFYDTGHGEHRVLSGATNTWQSVSEPIQDIPAVFVSRGEYLYKMNDQNITINQLSYDNVNKMTTLGIVTRKPNILYTETSMGEGLVMGDYNGNYSVYVKGKEVLNFKDKKDVISKFFVNVANKETSSLYYVDIQNKKMYIMGQWGTNYIYEIDLATGLPVFKNGSVKKIDLGKSVDPNKVRLVVDSLDNIYLFVPSDNGITLTEYNGNLEQISGPVTIPIKNLSKTFAVSQTLNELHLWDAYTYNMDDYLELVRISKTNGKTVNENKPTNTDNQTSTETVATKTAGNINDQLAGEWVGEGDGFVLERTVTSKIDSSHLSINNFMGRNKKPLILDENNISNNDVSGKIRNPEDYGDGTNTSLGLDLKIIDSNHIALTLNDHGKNSFKTTLFKVQKTLNKSKEQVIDSLVGDYSSKDPFSSVSLKNKNGAIILETPYGSGTYKAPDIKVISDNKIIITINSNGKTLKAAFFIDNNKNVLYVDDYEGSQEKAFLLVRN